MGITYYLMLPFTWLLNFFYGIFNSYGIALIFFTLVVTVILFPLSLKGKRSMIQMNMLSGQMQKLQKQYAKNQQKYNEEVQKLYEREGVSPMGGCLWSLIPMFILFPLYAIIRQPIKYMMGVAADQMALIARALNWDTVAVANKWITQEAVTKAIEDAGQNYIACFNPAGYDQLHLASMITESNLSTAQAAVGEGGAGIFPINFNFLGIDLSATPQLKFWENGLSWASIGLFLIPVLVVVTSLISSMVSMKTNQLNNSQQGQNSQNKTMMIVSSLMMVWFSFIMPAGMGIYIVANSAFRMVQDVICNKLLKKDYEKAEEARKQREIEEKEEEKRLRREKAEQRAREAEEARKNKGKKKPKAEEEDDKMSPEQKAASRVGMRAYARGRSYDPNRYGGVTPYHDGQATIETKPLELTEGPAPEDTAAPEEETPLTPVDEPPKTPTDRDPWDDQTKE